MRGLTDHYAAAESHLATAKDASDGHHDQLETMELLYAQTHALLAIAANTTPTHVWVKAPVPIPQA